LEKRRSVTVEFALQGSGKRSLAYVAAAILVAAVLVSATLILVPLSRPPTTVTETSATTATETTTSTSVTTTTETTTSTSVTTSTETSTSTGITTTTETTTTTSVVTLPAGCLPSQSNGYSYVTLVAGASSPAIICLQVYWFNSTSPMVLNATSVLQIGGFSPSSGNPIPDPAANFTVAASTDQLALGGPTNAGEGTVLAYSITAKAGASGTYWLAVKASQLGGTGLRECGPDAESFGSLLAGNGQPDYVPPSYLPVCISGGVPTFSIPGVGYTVPAGFLCYRIISLTNSTQ
jgi:hypothetical protein